MTSLNLPLTDLSQADPGWLTNTLKGNGCLAQGRVTQVTYDVLKHSKHIDIARLQVGYSTGAISVIGATLPTTLILKISKAGASAKRSTLFGRREYALYTQIAAVMDNPPIARCYDAASDSQSGKFHFLLEDLSVTHSVPSYPLPPPVLDCEQIMECLARFHAAWWNDPRIGTKIGRPLLQERRSKRATVLQQRAGEFLAVLGDRVSSARHNALRDACALYPRLLARQNSGALTITHGDAHYGNFMVAPGRADCRIIDWENWEVGPATDDLAYMIAAQWFAERRQRLEQDLLRRYHRALVASGVQDYSWDTRWNDYRLSAIKHLCTPANQWADGLSPRSWWNNLERRLASYEDLGCAEIMEQLKCSPAP